MIGETLLKILGEFVELEHNPYTVIGFTLNKIVKDTDYMLDSMSGDIDDTRCDY